MRLVLAALALAALATPAAAQDALRDLCPDRPGKGASPCTVDQGHWQLEVDAVDGTFQRQGGVTTDAWLIAAPTLKYGVSDRLDLEASVVPYERVRMHDAGGTTTDSGAGDVNLLLKWAPAGNGGDTPFILEPFVKLPTAKSSLGNGKTEGGVRGAVSFALPEGWSLGLTPEVDDLVNAVGSGRHAQWVGVAGLGHAAGPLNLGVELWGARNDDPSGKTTQASFDVSGALIPKAEPALQIDAGINLGLNRATPGVQVYTGLSRRF